MLLGVALAVLVCQSLEEARAQVKAPPVYEADSVDPGSIGHVIYQAQVMPTSIPPVQPTNTGTVVIGSSSSYVVLVPTTNATLQLSVSTTDINGIELAVYSQQNLYTFIAAASSSLNHTNVASVTFSAVAHVVYDIQLTGVGTINFNYGLGIGPAFTLTPSSEIVATGCPATFGTTATGIPAPSFQWQFQDADIPGATNATYTIAHTAASNAGNYRVRSTNGFGTVISPEANLGVVPVTVAPPSLAADQSFHFTVTGLAGQTYAVEASTNLVNWTTAFTGAAGLNGSLMYTDSQVTNTALRFFRARAVCN